MFDGNHHCEGWAQGARVGSLGFVVLCSPQVFEEQSKLGESLTASMDSQDAAMLSRVRVLRDGPMGQVRREGKLWAR